jgi:hypothetical protein
MTSIHMLPADDPSSVESFLRGRSGQPSYRGPRKRAIKAMRNAQARREREDAQRPYDADRLARNLAEREGCAKSDVTCELRVRVRGSVW